MINIAGNWINLTKYKGERFFYNVSERNNKYILNKKSIDGKSPLWNNAEWTNVDNVFSGKYNYNNFIISTTGLYFNDIIVWSDNSISFRFDNMENLNYMLEGILIFYKYLNMNLSLSKTSNNIVEGIIENIIKTKENMKLNNFSKL